MGEVEIVADAVQAAAQTEQPISDLAARIVASWWHGGQSSALYKLTSSGYIDLEEVVAEIEHDLEQVRTNPGYEVDRAENERDLQALLAYVKANGARDAQPDWDRLSW